MRVLGPGVWASPQLTPSDLPALAQAGVRRLINNRPDHEQPGQYTSEQIEAAARAVGLDYLWLPVVGMPDPIEATAVADALKDGVPTLLFCRSGMRSAAVWAMASRACGEDAAGIRAAAAKAGYDLSGLPL